MPRPMQKKEDYHVVGFFNKNSGRHQQHGRVARMIIKYAKGKADLYVTDHPDQVKAVIEQLMDLPSHVKRILVFGGGDGTQNKGINDLFNEHPELLTLPLDQRPLLFPIPLGKENLVWNSTVRPGLSMDQQLERVMIKINQGYTLDTMFVRTLEVNDRRAFIYGSGLASRFLEQYYASLWYEIGMMLPTRPKWRIFFAKLAAVSVALSGVVRAGTFVPAWQKLTKPMPAKIITPGHHPETIDVTLPTTIMASTITRIGLGFKGMPTAMDHPDKFMLRTTEMGLLGFVGNLRKIYTGKDITKITDAMVDRVLIDYGCDTVRMVDGDLLEPARHDEIRLGPAVNIIAG